MPEKKKQPIGEIRPITESAGEIFERGSLVKQNTLMNIVKNAPPPPPPPKKDKE